MIAAFPDINIDALRGEIKDLTTRIFSRQYKTKRIEKHAQRLLDAAKALQQISFGFYADEIVKGCLVIAACPDIPVQSQLEMEAVTGTLGSAKFLPHAEAQIVFKVIAEDAPYPDLKRRAMKMLSEGGLRPN